MSKMTQETINGLDNWFKQTIAAQGYVLQGVDTGENTVSYMYTIGLTARGELDYLFEFPVIPINVGIAKLVVTDRVYQTDPKTNGQYVVSLELLGDTRDVCLVIRREPAEYGKEKMLGCYNTRIIDTPPKEILVVSIHQPQESFPYFPG